VNRKVPIQAPLSTFFYDLIAVLAVILAGVRFKYGVEGFFDIALMDETNYLASGRNLAASGLPQAAMAPLYAVWYYLLGLVESDSIGLFYLNIKLLAVIPAVLTYALLRRNQVSVLVSMLVAWYTITAGFMQSWPLVSHFALVCILVTLLLASRRDLFSATLIIAMGALLTSFVRPEYFVAFVLAIFVLLFLAKDDGMLACGRRQYTLGAFILTIGCLIALFGVPLGGSRSLVAFGQHFSLHWVGWTHSSLNPWTEWQTIISRNFSGATSLTDAVASNPVLFGRHMLANLYHVPQVLIHAFFPINIRTDDVSEALLALILLLSLWAACRGFSDKLASHKGLLLGLMIFVVPPLVSVTVIYPREHYITFIACLMMIFIAVFTGGKGRGIIPNGAKFVPLALLLIAVVPSVSGLKRPMPTLKTIEFLRTLGVTKTVNLLEEEGGYGIYVGKNYHRINPVPKRLSFNAFAKKTHLNAIVLSRNLLKDSRLRDDSEWKYFLKNYNRFGFIHMPIPKTSRDLLIRKALLTR